MCGYMILFMMTCLVAGVECQEKVFAGVGSVAVLPCVFKPAPRSAPIIHWTKDDKGPIWRKEQSGLEYWGHVQGRSQRMRCRHPGAVTGDYSLYVNNVREGDEGVYTCQVKDGGRLINSTKVTLVVMNVFVSPVDPVEGADLSIKCTLSPWPRGATVRWRLNGELFSPQDVDQIREVFTPRDPVSKSMLKGRASQGLAGTWTCSVQSQKAAGQASKSLSVAGVVSPSTDSTIVYAAVGSAVSLPCTFSPGVIPSDHIWERLAVGETSSSTPLPLPPSFNLSSITAQLPWDRSVYVQEVGTGDGGWYRCSGMISAHRVARKVQLVTAKVTLSRKKASLTLACHLSNTSEVTGYDWVRVTYDQNGTQSESFVQKGETLRFNRVTEENAGEWTCRFYGKQGILGNVTHHLTLMGGQTGDEEGASTGGTTTVICLSFLLLVLLVALAQMYKNYQRRQRILMYPALETIVHDRSNEKEKRERNRVKEDNVSM